MTVKEHLHQIIEKLPQERLDEARNLLESLAHEESISYMDVIDRIIQEIPSDELEKFPTDLSENLDHYAYGKPKK